MYGDTIKTNIGSIKTNDINNNQINNPIIVDIAKVSPNNIK